MPHGRGGAGNFYHAQAQSAEPSSSDVEAQRSSSGPPTSDLKQEPRQYAYSGRGGAGNLYSPQELASTGTFTNSAAPVSSSTQTSTTSTSRESNPSVASDAPNTFFAAALSHAPIFSAPEPPKGKIGRGGAGNMIWDSGTSDDQARQEREEHEKKVAIEESVGRAVDSKLARPQEVYRGQGRQE